MSIVYLVLFLVFVVTLWVLLTDDDEVHNLAATTTGMVAAFWLFMITGLAIKILIFTLLLAFSQRFHPLRK